MMPEGDYERFFQEARKEIQRTKVLEVIAIVAIVFWWLVFIYGILKIHGVI